jgi:GTPase involved in cell partitioning and DNA repair
MATQIPERPGSFREFVGIATDSGAGGSGGVSVTEFKYRYSAGQVRGGCGGGVGFSRAHHTRCTHLSARTSPS